MFATRASESHALLLSGVEYTGGSWSDWSEFTATDGANQSAHECERLSRQIVIAKCAVDLAGLDGEILAYERTDPNIMRLTFALSPDGDDLSKSPPRDALLRRPQGPR